MLELITSKIADGYIMKPWQEEPLNMLSDTQNEQEFFECLASLAQGLGFDYYSYVLRLPFPFSGPKTVLFNNYPTAWETRYHSQNYLVVDPTVRQGLRSLLPILWTDELFSTAPELWDEARSFGLRHGWAQSSRDLNGTLGMMTLARSHEPLSKAELRDKSSKMAWLSQMAHLGMSQCLTPKLIPTTQADLSDREVEILRWTADGKTSGEIACILNISERTVNFHVNNAMVKLNASNKMAAVTRAAVLGLLH